MWSTFHVQSTFAHAQWRGSRPARYALTSTERLSVGGQCRKDETRNVETNTYSFKRDTLTARVRSIAQEQPTLTPAAVINAALDTLDRAKALAMENTGNMPSMASLVSIEERIGIKRTLSVKSSSAVGAHTTRTRSDYRHLLNECSTLHH